ncbi:MAG: type II toxin-antitoxin system HicA family toxin [Planctomycetes bacterium]|nr:type II toxin-antitoxin system HicA family toxin [Planctomycetota bacterium]
MKRTKLLRHLSANGCNLIREGRRHSIYANSANDQTAPVPRHNEIDSMLVRQICKELGIDAPAER